MKLANHMFLLTFWFYHFCSSKENIHSAHQFFHAERLCNIIITTCSETLQFIFLHRFSSKENDRYHVASLPDLFSQTKSIPVWHVHIQQTYIGLLFLKLIPGYITIRTIDNVESFFFKIILNNKRRRI